LPFLPILMQWFMPKFWIRSSFPFADEAGD
jgi:hypothetical protein